MSVRCITWVWDHSQAEGTERLILLALADNANDRGECWPSVAELARKAKVSERTVQRALRSLEGTPEKPGELVTVRGGTAGRGSNHYRIDLDPRVRLAPDPGVILSPRQSDTGCQSDRGDSLAPVQTGTDLDNNRGVILSPVTTVSPEPSKTTTKPKNSSPSAAAFDEFWSVYPRHVGKQGAEKVWKAQLAKGVDPAVIIAGAARYRDDRNRDPEFTCHPSTWLNRGSWDDDPLPARIRPANARTGPANRPAWEA